MWHISTCNSEDGDFPRWLMESEGAPKVLYYVGDISICAGHVIGVIGKRDAEEFYLKRAYSVGKTLAENGYVILNGLAVGCDTRAVVGALDHGGKVVAVMPRGLDEVYPQGNQKLAERIVATGGCLVSEYQAGEGMKKYTFVQRDRIQAILSEKIVVIAADMDGGTMKTVEYARRFSKGIGAVSEDYNVDRMNTGKDDYVIEAAGNRYLIENGYASRIADTDGLLEFLRQPEFRQMSFFDCLF